MARNPSQKSTQSPCLRQGWPRIRVPVRHASGHMKLMHLPKKAPKTAPSGMHKQSPITKPQTPLRPHQNWHPLKTQEVRGLSGYNGHAHIIQDNVQVCIACAHILAAE